MFLAMLCHDASGCSAPGVPGASWGVLEVQVESCGSRDLGIVAPAKCVRGAGARRSAWGGGEHQTKDGGRPPCPQCPPPRAAPRAMARCVPAAQWPVHFYRPFFNTNTDTV